jgi:hypothetical protein
MYSFVINKDTPEEIYTAICDYCNYHGTNNTKKHLGLKTKYIYNIYKQMDVARVNRDKYRNIDDMFINFNKEEGTNKNLKIKKNKYKRVILLLLAYYHKIVIFV